MKLSAARGSVLDDLNGVVGRLTEAQGLRKLVGRAPALMRAIEQLPLIARHRGSVLITGETGTGKELVARAIHYLSDRATQPFVPVNCGSLSEPLVEDALFGHESGAFTDARGRSIGLVAAADGGTLLLDEIGTLRSGAQTALLRFLQDGTYRPIGSVRDLRSDVRVIAATNAPLDRMAQDGTFRADLYYRLRVFSIDLPPLRERIEDIPLLAAHFLQRHSPPERSLEIGADASAALMNHAWPGNVRELEHTIIRAAAVCRGPMIGAEDLGLPSSGGRDTPPDDSPVRNRPYQLLKREAIATFEKRYLCALLADHRGNVTHAARAAGKDRRELAKLLKKHTLDAQSFRSA